MKKANKNLLIILIIILILIILITVRIIKLKDKYSYFSPSELRSCRTIIPYYKLNTGKLRGLSYNNLILEQNFTLNILFKSLPSSDFPRLDVWGASPYYDENGNYIKYDPFHESLRHEKITLAIKKIVNERYGKIVNIKFNFSQYDVPHIIIDFNKEDGCWSKVGKDSLSTSRLNKVTMNFAWFSVGTVLHEFGHALGLEHEHQSPFGEPVKFKVPEVYDWCWAGDKWDEKTCNEQVVNPLPRANLNGSAYDPESIMLYEYPKKITVNKKGTRKTERLSKQDVIYLNSIYPTGAPNAEYKETIDEFYKRVYKEKLR